MFLGSLPATEPNRYSSSFLKRPHFFTKSPTEFDVCLIKFKSTKRFCQIFEAFVENLNFIDNIDQNILTDFFFLSDVPISCQYICIQLFFDLTVFLKTDYYLVCTYQYVCSLLFLDCTLHRFSEKLFFFKRCSPSNIFMKRIVRPLEMEGRGRGIVMGSDTLISFKVLYIESATTKANNTSYKSFMTVDI